MPQRMQQLEAWVKTAFGEKIIMSKLAGDASFRQYYRVARRHKSWVVMDAPPQKEDVMPFLRVAAALRQAGLTAPQAVAVDLDRGFVALTDFGDKLYSLAFTEESPALLCHDALEAIAIMQTITEVEDHRLHEFDEAFIVTELRYFKDWFIDKYLNMELTHQTQVALERAFQEIVMATEEQPYAFVHRDYHSRNLLRVDKGNPAILDFQDAVWGPISYDLVSLLKDCYISWDRAFVLTMANDYWSAHVRKHLGQPVAWDTFLRWFDIVGIQRHLKVLGIFSRLYLRDGKDHYLANMPRILDYLIEACALYPEYTWLGDWLANHIVPLVEKKQKLQPCEP